MSELRIRLEELVGVYQGGINRVEKHTSLQDISGSGLNTPEVATKLLEETR